MILFSNGLVKVFQSIPYWRYLHIISLQSTSFIEEEHQTIYFIATTLFTLQCFNTNLKNGQECLKNLLALLILGFARRLNQTGNKWIHLPDIGDWLQDSENSLIFVISLAITLIIVIQLQNQRKLNGYHLGWIVLVYGMILIHKTSEVWMYKLLWPSRIVYAGVSVRIIYNLFAKKSKFCENLAMELLPILALISQPHNLILIPLHLILHKIMEFQTLDHYYLMGWCLYFNQVKYIFYFSKIFHVNLLFVFQGNSNHFTTIDLTPAYTGLTSFEPYTVGTLLTLSVFMGPILWLLLFASTVMSQENFSMSESMVSFLMSRGLEIFFFLSLVTFQRHHLFIWSVFSPKLLYLGMTISVTNILLTIFILCDSTKNKMAVYKKE